MKLPPPRLAERMGAHASSLEMQLADVAELLVRNHLLVDVLPFRWGVSGLMVMGRRVGAPGGINRKGLEVCACSALYFARSEDRPPKRQPTKPRPPNPNQPGCGRARTPSPPPWTSPSPLRPRQHAEGLAGALRVPFVAAVAMVVREAGLLKVQPHVLEARCVVGLWGGGGRRGRKPRLVF